MKKNSFRSALVALTALVVLSSLPASAQTYVSVRVGTPPPPIIVESRPPLPYHNAVWIGGHHEWINGRWVWVRGYYTRVPYGHPGAVWVPAHYRYGYYYPGRWRY